MVDFCCVAESDTNSVELRKRLADKIETCSKEMFDKVMKYFKKTKFDRFYPKDVQDNFAQSMEELLKEICDIVLVLQNDLNSFSKNADDYGWQASSPHWR
jgi:hypothetical protein